MLLTLLELSFLFFWLISQSDLVELVKGTGVYITVQKRTCVILKGKKGPTFMLRKLLGVLFSPEELRNGCAVGGRKTAVNKLPDGSRSIPLDSKKLDAAKGKTFKLPFMLIKPFVLKVLIMMHFVLTTAG